MHARQATSTHFSGSVPEIYDMYLAPLILEPYAIDLARRLGGMPITNVLELAAGTGVVTRRLTMSLPASVFIIATDVSQSMLELAAAVGTSRPVEWRQADALQLPFDKASFDAVVCQFGVMFFADRQRAYAEARRVLRSGGVFIFNAWDRIEENEFPMTVSEALARAFPEDPPRYMARVPYGYHDIATIRRDLSASGFSEQPEITTVANRSRAAAARVAAMAFCQGMPLRSESDIRDLARDSTMLAAATDAAEAALAARFGHSAIDGKIQAHVIAVYA